MTQKILILGAAGRLGKACAVAFRDAGWDVVSFVKPGKGMNAAERTSVIEDDALDREAVIEAAAGAHVILNAVNFPFADWPKKLLAQNEVAIAAAERIGATLLSPGNLYVYGRDLPPRIDETTPMNPQSRKGKLRLRAEADLKAAASRGVRCILLRAGDFYGGTNFGSWFDLVIARDIDIGVVRYPGTLLTPHAWAYLPDLAQAFVRLAAARDRLEPYAEFGFPGHPPNGLELMAAIRESAQKGLRRRRFPWWMLRLGSLFVANWRDIIEVSHLWKLPHRIEGDKLRAAIGEIPETPFPEAVARALDALGFIRLRQPENTAD